MSGNVVPDRWERYLDTMLPLDMLILEQIYVVEEGPVSTDLLRRRLGSHGATIRSIDSHVDWLERQGLVRSVRSCGRLVSPIFEIDHNVTTLVRLWRYREERRLRMEMADRSETGIGMGG